MDRQVKFCIGEKIVYPLLGVGRVDEICTRKIDAQPQPFYRLVLGATHKGEVLVPVAQANALGLRYPLRASEVSQVLQQVQCAATQPVTPGQMVAHYAWCKMRLRQGDVLGLAEVWRFLHDLERVERITAPQLKHIRDYVRKQLPAEIAAARHCPRTEAEQLLTTALHEPAVESLTKREKRLKRHR